MLLNMELICGDRRSMNMDNKDDNNMSAEQMLAIFMKTRPHLFDHIYKECNLIHNQEPL